MLWKISVTIDKGCFTLLATFDKELVRCLMSGKKEILLPLKGDAIRGKENKRCLEGTSKKTRCERGIKSNATSYQRMLIVGRDT